MANLFAPFPTTSLTLSGGSQTGVTLSGISITGTAGQFSCNSASLSVGQFVTISGTLGGTGSITGYSNPTTYLISATNGSTTFTLVVASTGAAIVTTAGTPTGLTYTVTSPLANFAVTWNNSSVAFTGLKLNVTDTASNASSLLMDFQVGGSSQFSLRKDGIVRVPSQAAVGGMAAISAIGSGTNTGLYFSNNSWVGIQVNNGSMFAFTSSIAATPGFYVGFNQNIAWSSGAYPGYNALNGDLFISRRGAANLRFGAADAAAPVAQTLSVQSVVAGTSNTAGANLTITGSQGTGTGVGGDIIFQVAPAGTTGTAQNALTTALRVYNDKTVFAGAGFTVATLPAAGTAGRRAYVTDATAPTFLGTLTGGGAVVTPVFDNGTAWVAG